MASRPRILRVESGMYVEQLQEVGFNALILSGKTKYGNPSKMKTIPRTQRKYFN